VIKTSLKQARGFSDWNRRSIIDEILQLISKTIVQTKKFRNIECRIILITTLVIVGAAASFVVAVSVISLCFIAGRHTKIKVIQVNLKPLAVIYISFYIRNIICYHYKTGIKFQWSALARLEFNISKPLQYFRPATFLTGKIFSQISLI
jgi:hypothetical protein